MTKRRSEKNYEEIEKKEKGKEERDEKREGIEAMKNGEEKERKGE